MRRRLRLRIRRADTASVEDIARNRITIERLGRTIERVGRLHGRRPDGTCTCRADDSLMHDDCATAIAIRDHFWPPPGGAT